jgi:hypothetical protein
MSAPQGRPKERKLKPEPRSGEPLSPPPGEGAGRRVVQ